MTTPNPSYPVTHRLTLTIPVVPPSNLGDIIAGVQAVCEDSLPTEFRRSFELEVGPTWEDDR